LNFLNNEMTLEEELLEKGFEVIGPNTVLDLGKEFVRLFSRDERSIRIYVIHKENTSEDNPKLHMMYYRYENLEHPDITEHNFGKT